MQGCLVINNALSWTSNVVNAMLGDDADVRGLIAKYQRNMFSSGTYQCIFDYGGDSVFLNSMTWILSTVWEVAALCLAVWIAVKQFRELQQHSTRGVIGDCFRVLMKPHIGFMSSTLLVDLYTLDAQIYEGFAEIFELVGLFVLGPRLILGVREYHAELVAKSDTATTMTSIAFQEHVQVLTSSSV
ncbi:hypothetical protein DFJ58DRAFT_894332 [Suillus subalutaceus]|uniref:uncharacterized protein n=1 Tax=Suillus subalutaceus TaxID=48586 RepID=UPI001B86B570|nr:uncharacterized protein DFJ58DRAFT_894332 [Suillus subalutaceus]KAG1844808.1 hypothetical protein DFJ58DRAFT_894332 [Suillus subalutaceus]